MEAETEESSILFSEGDLVRIEGLKDAPRWNGQIAVVLRYHDDQGRFEIRPSRGSKTLAIKGTNLTRKGLVYPDDPEFGKTRAFDNLFLWPPAQEQHGNDNNEKTLPVQGFLDLPGTTRTDWKAQDDYLCNLLKWEFVDHVGGVEEQGRERATFLMLFDKNDRTSPINHAAQSILDLLPEHQTYKYEGLKLRGVCVLTYSPVKVTLGNITGFRSQQMAEANEDRKFTQQQLYNIVKFHSTKAARKQYRHHDDPIHRAGAAMDVIGPHH